MISDLTDLIHHLAGQMGGVVVSPEALSVLESYSWPGNIRELKNVLLSAVAVS